MTKDELIELRKELEENIKNYELQIMSLKFTIASNERSIQRMTEGAENLTILINEMNND